MTCKTRQTRRHCRRRRWYAAIIPSRQGDVATPETVEQAAKCAVPVTRDADREAAQPLRRRSSDGVHH